MFFCINSILAACSVLSCTSFCIFCCVVALSISPAASALSASAFIFCLSATGLFGVGGGFLIVPLLLILSAVTMVQAVSTSLLIIAMISTSGFISHLYFAARLDWILFAGIAGAAVFGMVLGQFFGKRFANALLQKIFAVSLFIVSMFMMIEFLIK